MISSQVLKNKLLLLTTFSLCIVISFYQINVVTCELIPTTLDLDNIENANELKGNLEKLLEQLLNSKSSSNVGHDNDNKEKSFGDSNYGRRRRRSGYTVLPKETVEIRYIDYLPGSEYIKSFYSIAKTTVVNTVETTFSKESVENLKEMTKIDYISKSSIGKYLPSVDTLNDYYKKATDLLSSETAKTAIYVVIIQLILKILSLL